MRTKGGRTVIGCDDGLFELKGKDRQPILGGGYIFGLATDEEGTIFGTSAIAGHSIFTLDDDLRVRVIVDKAPVYYGLSVSRNRVYFVVSENGYKVRLLEDGVMRDVMSSGSAIYALACHKDSLFVGNKTRLA